MKTLLFFLFISSTGICAKQADPYWTVFVDDHNQVWSFVENGEENYDLYFVASRLKAIVSEVVDSEAILGDAIGDVILGVFTNHGLYRTILCYHGNLLQCNSDQKRKKRKSRSL